MTAPRSAADDLPALLEAFADVIRLVDPASTSVRRLRVSAAEASVEVEWPETAAPDGPPAVITTMNGNGNSNGNGVAAAGRIAVRSPIVGTFYRAPEQGGTPFVSTGDVVHAGQQVAIVEAMKLMNPVHATADGRVLDILLDDGTPVEYDQELILLAPVD